MHLMENQLEISLLKLQRKRHPNFSGKNLANAKSTQQLQDLTENMLLPLQEKLGSVQITYGFTRHSLLRYILKNSPGDMAPDIDQHASMELNSKDNCIYKRDGAACDFYGKDRPIHISVGPDNSQ